MNEEGTEVTGENGKHAACEAFSSLKVKKPQLPHVPQPLYHALTPQCPALTPHHPTFHSPSETADTVEKFIDDNTRQNCILVQCVPH